MISIKLEELLITKEKSLYWLAKETGISYPTLFRISKGKSISISLSILDRICTVLGCSSTQDILSFENTNSILE